MKVFKLETNYRCSASVCCAASALIVAGGGKERTLPRPGAPEGSATLHEFADEQAEVKFIAQKIRELECEKSCGILLRTNALCDQYRLALEAYGLPVSKRERGELPGDWAAVRALIAALVNPSNDLLCEGLLMALHGKEKAEEMRCDAIAAQVGVNERCLQLPYDLDAVGACNYAVSKHTSSDSVAKLRVACEAAGEGATVSDLLMALHEPEKAEVIPGVVVSTIHSAKGLEWDCVFICAAEEGVLPSHRDEGDSEALAEARRLFYVAMTRARLRLFVTWCRSRREKWHSESNRQPSRFAMEAECERKQPGVAEGVK